MLLVFVAHALELRPGPRGYVAAVVEPGADLQRFQRVRGVDG
jgi:hypothetical protein